MSFSPASFFREPHGRTLMSPATLLSIQSDFLTISLVPLCLFNFLLAIDRANAINFWIENGGTAAFGHLILPVIVVVIVVNVIVVFIVVVVVAIVACSSWGNNLF